MPLVQLPGIRKRKYHISYYVRYEDREEAKKHGARWDPNIKCWYRTYVCSNDEDVEETSARSCGLRILSIDLIDEWIEPGNKIRLNVPAKDILESGCLILDD